MKKLHFLVLSLASALCASAFAISFNIKKDIRYSNASERCVLDVKWPNGVTNFATVINFHGGGLVAGNKHFACWPGVSCRIRDSGQA